jgi:hypothetical protein
VVFVGNPSPFLARCHCFAEGKTEPAAGVQKGAWEMGNGWYVFLAGLFGMKLQVHKMIMKGGASQMVASS